MASKLWKLAGVLGIVILIVLTQIPSSEAKAENSDFQTENGVLIRYIGSNAEVEVPETVTVIGEEAFSGTAVEKVTIPDSVREIRNGAFSDCQNLQTVEIGDGVSKIGSSAFMQCTALTSVTFGSSVRELGTGIFSGCLQLSEIEIDEDNTSIVCEDGVLLNAERTCLYEMLNGRPGVVYEMPDTITSVRRYAFWDCRNVRLLVLSDSLKEIVPYTFTNCISLQAVAIPGSVTTIGAKAFSDCHNLETVTLTASTKDIHATAFDGCENVAIYAPDNSIGARYAADNDYQSASLDAFTALRNRLIEQYEAELAQTDTEEDRDEADANTEAEDTDDGNDGMNSDAEGAVSAGNTSGAPAVSRGVLYGQTAIVSGEAVVFINNTDQQVYSGPAVQN